MSAHYKPISFNPTMEFWGTCLKFGVSHTQLGPWKWVVSFRDSVSILVNRIIWITSGISYPRENRWLLSILAWMLSTNILFQSPEKERCCKKRKRHYPKTAIGKYISDKVHWNKKKDSDQANFGQVSSNFGLFFSNVFSQEPPKKEKVNEFIIHEVTVMTS